MNPFVLSPLAAMDIEDIWRFVAKDDIEAADRLSEKILQAAYRLTQLPWIGHLREELSDRNLRVWLVGAQLLIYDPNSKPLRIYRVVSGHRDLAGLQLGE